MTILVTGAAGFIGYHLCCRLLKEGESVIGFDNLNSYYDPKLKEARLSNLQSLSGTAGSEFNFIRGDLEDNAAIDDLFGAHQPRVVVNLAAQAGVRYSIDNPSAYIRCNIVGFGNILEACRRFGVDHLVYASSSSVYGGNQSLPFSETQNVDHPVSLYAASKKANELMAHTYSHLYGLPTTGLRFFTVYGPWGRPDMALFLFTKSIIAGQPIKVYNNGEMIRDFTYIDDIIESIRRLIRKPAEADSHFSAFQPNPPTSWAPYRVFNIGNSSPIPLLEYIAAVEEALGIKATKHFMPLQPGDVPATSADTTSLESWIDFKPNTSVREGVMNFVKWYCEYYGENEILSSLP